jgi:hypothetical protein
MKFLNYIVESSFPDKLFKLVNSFTSDKGSLLSQSNLQKFIYMLADAFTIRISLITTTGDCAAHTSADGSIRVEVPTKWLAKSSKDELNFKNYYAIPIILGNIFHELAHVSQIKSKHDTLSQYFKVQPGQHSWQIYTQYYLQSAERSPQSISDSIAFVINRVDPFKMLEQVKTLVQGLQIQSIPNEGEELNKLQNILDVVPSECWGPLVAYGTTLYFAHCAGVSDDDTKKKAQMFMNQWKVFFKNFKHNYDKFKFYFEKYKII